MPSPTLATRPLDERLYDLIVERARGGVTTLHPRHDLPRLLDAEPKAVRAAMYRLSRQRRILITTRPGGVREFRVLDGDACPVCGSRLR